MKKSHFYVLAGAAASLLGAVVLAVAYPGAAGRLPSDFGDRAFKHIEALASMGHRQAGSENDARAVSYLKSHFEEIGLAVEVQPFAFESFEYSSADLTIDGRGFPLLGLGLNPYLDSVRFEGTAVVIEAAALDALPRDGLRGRAVVTNDWSAHFRLMRLLPGLVMYLSGSDFEGIRSRGEVRFRLQLAGGIRSFQTANVIARVGPAPPGTGQIWISAHYDTYRQDTPGASDNASGVGVLLELARHFKSIEGELSCGLKFIAFGGEEVGTAGSRAFLRDNAQFLGDCALLFNIDDVGGNRRILVERDGGPGGIEGADGLRQDPHGEVVRAWEGIGSRWRLLPDEETLKAFGAGHHPDWLADIVTRSVQDLGYEVVYTGTQGSDQMGFARAGWATSGVGIVSGHSHTAEDTPERIHIPSLKKAGEIAALIVVRTMNKQAKDRLKN